MKNVPVMARMIQRAGLYIVILSLMYLGTSVLLVCALGVMGLLPASNLQSSGKILQLVLNCLWLAVPGVIIWLVGRNMARSANKD